MKELRELPVGILPNKTEMWPLWMKAHLLLSYSCSWDKGNIIHVEALLLFPAKCSYLEQFKLKFQKRERNPAVAEQETPALGDNQDCLLDKRIIAQGMGRGLSVSSCITQQTLANNATQLMAKCKKLQSALTDYCKWPTLVKKAVSLCFSTEFRQLIKVLAVICLLLQTFKPKREVLDSVICPSKVFSGLYL